MNTNRGTQHRSSHVWFSSYQGSRMDTLEKIFPIKVCLKWCPSNNNASENFPSIHASNVKISSGITKLVSEFVFQWIFLICPSSWRSPSDTWYYWWMNSPHRHRSHYDSFPPKTRVNPSTGQKRSRGSKLLPCLIWIAFKTSYDYHKESDFLAVIIKNWTVVIMTEETSENALESNGPSKLGSIRGYNRKYPRGFYETSVSIELRLNFYLHFSQRGWMDYFKIKVSHELESIHGQIEDGILTPGENFLPL